MAARPGRAHSHDHFRMVKRGFTMADHLAEPANSAVFAHPRRFEVQESWSDGLVVLSVSGAVDILNAPRLTDAICNALTRAPAGLIVDLTEVNFLASVGMSILVAARDAADAMSVRFGVAAKGQPQAGRSGCLASTQFWCSIPPSATRCAIFAAGSGEPAPAQSL